jgi:glutamine synthetase
MFRSPISRFVKPLAQLARPAVRPFTLRSPNDVMNINTHVLDDANLKALIQPDVWKEFENCRYKSIPMPKNSKNAMARAIREWAQSRGCATYALWFSPVRGPIHGEKLETFMGVDFKDGRLLPQLTGTELFQTETDGSSFPNGGLRATHTAAAYVAWDTNSPPFIYSDTLYIPSAFFAWTGDALDNKLPLIKSSQAVELQSKRVLEHLGNKGVNRVITNVGWEQEFFIIDREAYLQRPDLVNTGRLLQGRSALRGQQQASYYFAKMPLRVRKFMQDIRAKMWAVGISVKCLHNEVAPAQHEISPIFSMTSHAADTNVLSMEILRDTAYEHGLNILFHEKPFAGLNGSGKHLNWGLNTDTGDNLYQVGKTPREKRNFVAFTAALTKAVKEHGDLLRLGIASAGNDHRLGGHEAPPAVLSLYLGKTMEANFRAIAAGELGLDQIGGDEDRVLPAVGSIPAVQTYAEDRNRTAPLPWCGNRFEFRACGSNQNISFPLAMLHAAVAESLRLMADRMDKGERPDAVIRDTLQQAQGALFSGNGYDPVQLNAVVRGANLFNLRESPEAYKQMTAAKNAALLTQHKIFSQRELEARRALLEEAYATDIQIESRVLLDMLKTGIAPAVARVQGSEHAVTQGLTSNALYGRRRQLFGQLLADIDKLDQQLADFPDSSTFDQAEYARSVLKPMLAEARKTADALEKTTDAAEWPFPHLDRILTRR